MKRYISILVVLAFMLCWFPLAVTADNNREEDSNVDYLYSEDISFVKMLDIMSVYDYDIFDAHAKVKRAEFAQIMSVVCKLDISVQMPRESSFSDVYIDNPSLPYIEAVVGRGIMSASSQGLFEPDKYVALNEAVKTIIDLLGYEPRAQIVGGYPLGYLTVANQLNILRRINTSGNADITRGGLARLIKNSVDVKMLYATRLGYKVSYDTFSDKTMLTEVMQLGKIKGVVEDNGFTSLRGNSKIGNRNIKISDMILVLPHELSFVRDYIGRRVEVYHTVEKDEELNAVVIARLVDTEDDVVFEINDFVALDGNSIAYFDGSHERKVTFATVPYIIYNGKAVDTLDKDRFDFEFGKVIITRSVSSNNYDTIIIEGYVSYYVTNVDESEQKIYISREGGSLDDDGYVLELRNSDLNQSVTIYDSAGNTGYVYNITPNSVIDICQNDNIMKIRLGKKPVFNIVIDEIGDDNKIVCGENVYRISQKYMETDGSLIPRIGEFYNLFLNSFGYVVRIQGISYSSLMVGYLIDIAPNRQNILQGQYDFKILSDRGQILILGSAKKVRVTDDLDSVFNLNGIELYGKLSENKGIIQYAVNNEGKVTQIRLPAKKTTKRQDGRFGSIYDANDAALFFSNSRGNCSGQFLIDANTIVFKVNINETDDQRRYQALAVNEVHDDTFRMSAYNMEVNSRYASYVVIPQSTAYPAVYRNWAVVTKVTDYLESDGRILKRVYAYRIAYSSAPTSVVLIAEPEVLDNAGDTTGLDNKYSVQAGDIIQYNTMNNYINRVQIIYRSNMENTTSPDGKRGGLLGRRQYRSGSELHLSNPFFLDNVSGDAMNWYTGPYRAVLGSIYSIDSKGNIVYTTQDLSSGEYDENYNQFNYIDEAVKLVNFITTVSYRGNEVIVEHGSGKDFRSYKDVGRDCSRIIVMTESGAVYRVIIINDEMGR